MIAYRLTGKAGGTSRTGIGALKTLG